MWRFIDLNDQQKLERRQYLDFYATLAQFSILLPISILQLYFLGRWVLEKLSREIPISPSSKKQLPSQSSRIIARLRAFSRTTLWKAGSEVSLWGYEATILESVAVAVYTALLLGLCTVQTQGGELRPPDTHLLAKSTAARNHRS